MKNNDISDDSSISVMNASEISDALLYRIRNVENDVIKTVIFSHNSIVSTGNLYGQGNTRTQAALLTEAFILTVKKLLSIGKTVVIATINNQDKEMTDMFVRRVLVIGFGDYEHTNQIFTVIVSNQASSSGLMRRTSLAARLRKAARITEQKNEEILYIDNQKDILDKMTASHVKIVTIPSLEGYGSDNRNHYFQTLQHQMKTSTTSAYILKSPNHAFDVKLKKLEQQTFAQKNELNQLKKEMDQYNTEIHRVSDLIIAHENHIVDLKAQKILKKSDLIKETAGYQEQQNQLDTARFNVEHWNNIVKSENNL